MVPKRKDIEDYFESLAASHVTLRHGINNRKTFYRMSADESAAVTTNAASPRLQMESYGGRFTGEIEAPEKAVSVAMKILSKADTTEAGKQAAYDEAETVMDDIIAKIFDDYLNNCQCFALRGIDFRNINFDKTGMEGLNEYGYRLTISIRYYATSYNPQKWI